MKCLSVRQPWAWAIVRGIKKIENRSWATSHCGLLLIHASLRYDGPRVTLPDGTPIPEVIADSTVFRGGIVGVAHVIDCVRRPNLPESLANNPFAEGPWCWILDDAKEYPPPIPKMRGRLGLFEADD